jgi:hypothetical protein
MGVGKFDAINFSGVFACITFNAGAQTADRGAAGNVCPSLLS